MKKFLLSLITVTLLLGMISTAALAKEPSYGDIADAVKEMEITSGAPVVASEESSRVSAYTDVKGHWAEGFINFITDEKLFYGISTTEFGPEVKMSREMFVTVLGRYEGVPNVKPATQVFSDVKVTDFSAPYVAWAAEKGITAGLGNGLFGAKEYVKRQDIAAFLGRYFAYKQTELQGVSPVFDFADQDQIDAYALDSVQFMQEVGLLSGTNGNRFLPNGFATRAEAATIFTQMIKSIKGERIYLKYGDSQIPTYTSVTLEDVMASYAGNDLFEGYLPEADAFVYVEAAGDYSTYVNYLVSQGFSLVDEKKEDGIAYAVYSKGNHIVGLAKGTVEGTPIVMVFPYLLAE